jgi:hypothetical protein
MKCWICQQNNLQKANFRHYVSILPDLKEMAEIYRKLGLADKYAVKWHK